MNGPQRQHITFTLPLIAATLELPSVQASDYVHFLLQNNGYCSWVLQHSIQNQVKVISDWLHRPYVSGGNHRSVYIRSLTIGSTEREHMQRSISENNVRQLIDDLKRVSFFILILVLFLKFYHTWASPG